MPKQSRLFISYISIFLVGSLCSISLVKAQDASAVAVQQAPDERDFLFLAEDEPGRQHELPDTQDEEVIEPGQQKLRKKALEEAADPKTCKVISKAYEEPVDDAFATEYVVETAKKPCGDTPGINEIKGNLQRQYPNEKLTPFIEHEKPEDNADPVLPPIFLIKKRNGEFSITGKYRPEVFYSKNNSFLNSCFPNDRSLYWRNTFDVTFNAACGTDKAGPTAVELKTTFRNKGVWGHRASVLPTTETTLNLAGANFGTHTHAIGRHVIWIREGWLKMQWNGVFNWDQERKHHLIVGYYPFKLGEGIALGDAYSVNGQLVGFYSDNVVDQYAPGVLFNGEFIKDRLSYDIYFAVLRNHTADFGSVSEPVYAQRFGFRNTPTRGFGHINWLIALRSKIVALKSNRFGTLQIEPYILYNQDPEQKIEFTADAESKLGTGGFAIDYDRGPLQISLEFAQNFGHQHVFGWDRNVLQITTDPTTAVMEVVNSEVTLDGSPAPATPANQSIINNAPQGSGNNYQSINGSSLINGDRFDDPYTTSFHGWMLVGDFAYWWFDKQVAFAAAAGIASGDNHPNILSSTDPKAKLPDGKYQGFIGLQEVYSGDLVESAYFLGQRRLVRPVSLVDDTLENSIVPAKVSEFSNLIYTGIAGHFKPKLRCKPYIRPNILWFWQDEPTRAFDRITNTISNCKASNFYGTELNLFVDVFPYDCLKFFAIAALFVPGGHYKDLKGLPVTAQAIKTLLRNPNETLTTAPSLGTSPAYFINLGFELKF